MPCFSQRAAKDPRVGAMTTRHAVSSCPSRQRPPSPIPSAIRNRDCLGGGGLEGRLSPDFEGVPPPPPPPLLLLRLRRRRPCQVRGAGGGAAGDRLAAEREVHAAGGEAYTHSSRGREGGGTEREGGKKEGKGGREGGREGGWEGGWEGVQCMLLLPSLVCVQPAVLREQAMPAVPREQSPAVLRGQGYAVRWTLR